MLNHLHLNECCVFSSNSPCMFSFIYFYLCLKSSLTFAEICHKTHECFSLPPYCLARTPYVNCPKIFLVHRNSNQTYRARVSRFFKIPTYFQDKYAKIWLLPDPAFSLIAITRQNYLHETHLPWKDLFSDVSQDLPSFLNF